VNKREFKKAVKARFTKDNPKWTPEHPDEINNVVNHLLDEGHITLKTRIGSAAKYVAEFIEPAF
jgi:hypothetical protein